MRKGWRTSAPSSRSSRATRCTRRDRSAVRRCANIISSLSDGRRSRTRWRHPPCRRPRRSAPPSKLALEDPGDHQPEDREENQKPCDGERQLAEDGARRQITARETSKEISA